MITIIRILHIVGGMNRGGLETFIMNLYRNINRDKIQFDFLVHTDNKCDYDDEIKKLGGKIYRIPPRRQGIIKNSKALDVFFKAHSEYKIVHQHVSSLTYIEPLKVAKKNNIPIRIIHSHSTRQGGSSFHKYIHKFNQAFIKSYATDYFACSDLAARWLFGNHQYNKGYFTIINNGIEVDKFIYSEQNREKIRKEFRVEDKLVIGHVGRFFYPKNHEFLLDIFKVIHDKIPDSILLLVGDGDLHNKIQEKGKALGIMDSIILTGVRSDVSDLLQGMDAFVFPSHYEGLPLTLIEAQSSGLMCFVSDVITKQVKITNLINYISLDKSAKYWAEYIIETTKSYNRYDASENIRKHRFDAKEVAELLCKCYISKMEEVL